MSRKDMAMIYYLVPIAFLTRMTMGQECRGDQYRDVENFCRTCTRCGDFNRDTVSNCTGDADAQCSKDCPWGYYGATIFGDWNGLSVSPCYDCNFAPVRDLSDSQCGPYWREIDEKEKSQSNFTITTGFANDRGPETLSGNELWLVVCGGLGILLLIGGIAGFVVYRTSNYNESPSWQSTTKRRHRRAKDQLPAKMSEPETGPLLSECGSERGRCLPAISPPAYIDQPELDARNGELSEKAQETALMNRALRDGVIVLPSARMQGNQLSKSVIGRPPLTDQLESGNQRRLPALNNAAAPATQEAPNTSISHKAKEDGRMSQPETGPLLSECRSERGHCLPAISPPAYIDQPELDARNGELSEKAQEAALMNRALRDGVIVLPSGRMKGNELLQSVIGWPQPMDQLESGSPRRLPALNDATAPATQEAPNTSSSHKAKEDGRALCRDLMNVPSGGTRENQESKLPAYTDAAPPEVLIEMTDDGDGVDLDMPLSAESQV